MTRKHRHNHASRGANTDITKITEVKTILPADGTAVELPLPEGIKAFFSEEGKLMLQKKSESETITYEEIAQKLFLGKEVYFDGGFDSVKHITCDNLLNAMESSNCKSAPQVRKMSAYTKLQNIAIYLNGDWRPTFGDFENKCWIIAKDKEGDTIPLQAFSYNVGLPVFKDEKTAENAIRIMGKKSIHDFFDANI